MTETFKSLENKTKQNKTIKSPLKSLIKKISAEYRRNTRNRERGAQEERWLELYREI